eukprot:TRINITY_DN2258_c0_g1_i10.p1 TRINITY_DN2258_c0_g1~~TRINITY_DN2258_c0_g1_i10.p1  ORF type:complete len:867 (+),score=142.90 TRINITY_DN2258_c0_g1_i10:232-2832(+)
MDLSGQRWYVRQGSPSSAGRGRDTGALLKPFSPGGEMELSGQRWQIRQGSLSSASHGRKPYDSGASWRSASGRSAGTLRKTFGSTSQNSSKLFPKLVAEPSRTASFDDIFSKALKSAAKRRAQTRQLHESLSLPLLTPYTIRGMISQKASKLSMSDDDYVVVETHEICTKRNSMLISGSKRGSTIGDVSQVEMDGLNDLAARCAVALDEDSDNDEPSNDERSCDKRKSRIGSLRDTQAISSTNLKTLPETAQNKNSKAQDPQEVTEILQLPDMTTIFRRILSDEDDLDDAERDRIALAFNQVKLPGDPDIHADNLQDVLSALGYLSNDETKVKEIRNSLTPYINLDFGEVCQFVRQYNSFEKSHVSQVFETYDADGSGELDTTEVRSVLEALGCSPFEGTLQRLIATVDMDSSGTLDFREFVLLVVVYRCTDGFSHKEIRELWRVFSRFAEQVPGAETVMRFPANKLRDAVILMGGPQSAAPLEKVLSIANPGGQPHTGKHIVRCSGELDEESGHNEGSSKVGKNGSLRFRQFVSWARRVKEAEMQEYVAQFKLFDQSGDGVLDAFEIRDAMHAMGYTPVRSAVKYLCKQVDADGSGELNLEEFLELMEYNKKWDGFTREQVDSLKKLFNRFKGADGEIMAVQVRELILLGGWKPSIRVIHEVIMQVDVDGSHSLNFREFLRLMRLFREADLVRLKGAFANALSKLAPDEENNEQETEDCEAKDRCSRTFIPLKKIRPVLSSVGYCYAKIELSDIVSKTFASYEGEADLDQVDFDRFVDLCDACRIDCLRKKQLQAGFSDAEVLEYRLCFCRNDVNHNGAIDRDECLGLTKELGLELQTKEDQRNLISLIQDARSAAADAGVPEAP